jgi:hypothetical protein
MTIQNFFQTIQTSQVDGAALANTVTATSILPAQARYLLPANAFQFIGQQARIKASGRISNTVTAVNLTLDVRFGPTQPASTIVFTGGANSLVARATTNVTWDLELTLTLRAVGGGTSANFMGIGRLISEACLGSVTNVAVVGSLPLSAPVVGTGFDSTSSNYVDLFATWGTAAAGNSITCHQYALDLNL